MAAGCNPFMKYGEVVRIPKHTPIRNPTAESQHDRLYVLVEGVCSLSTFAESGKESVILYFKPGDFVGYVPLLIEEKRMQETSSLEYLTGVSTYSKTDCKLSRISGATFSTLRKNAEFNEMLMDSVFRHYQCAVVAHRIRASKAAPAAVAAFVLYQSEADCNGRQSLSSFFTYSEISKSLDLHPVSVGRVISALIKTGALVREGRKLVVKNYRFMVGVANEEIDLKY